MMVSLLRMFCWTAALVFALNAAVSEAHAEQNIETVTQGSLFSGPTGRAYHVIRSPDEWQNLWDRIHADGVRSPPLPEVDFTTRSVIAVFQGWQPTGGYWIRIRRVVGAGGGTVVTVREVAPGASCGVTLVIENPFHIVSVPILAEGPVSFRVEPKTPRCG